MLATKYTHPALLNVPWIALGIIGANHIGQLHCTNAFRLTAAHAGWPCGVPSDLKVQGVETHSRYAALHICTQRKVERNIQHRCQVAINGFTGNISSNELAAVHMVFVRKLYSGDSLFILHSAVLELQLKCVSAKADS